MLKVCPRCGGSLASSSMSFFNTEIICATCHREEQHLPGYAHAREIEEAEVLKGNYRYQGVGLTAEDIAAIARLIAQRPKKG